MAGHPGLEQLIAFAAREVDDTGTATLARHLAGCVECAGTVARYQLAAATLRADDSPAPPLPAIARAKALFAEQTLAAPESIRDMLAPLRRIVAELIFDSGGGLSPAVAGFRGGGDRHLTYVAEAMQVDLRLQPPAEAEGSWRVHGQLDADDLPPRATVDMVLPGEEQAVARAMTDERGIFALAAPSGLYDILVRLPDAVQVLPGLDLR